MNRLLTFSLRAPMRGGRALALLFCACLALASSCSKDYPTCPDCPGTPALIPGNFELAAVDGKLLPYNPPNQTVTILSGDCVTTSNEFTMHITTTNGKDTVTATSKGFILPYNKGTVTFSFEASSTQATGLINGGGFSLQYNSLVLQFDRKG
jgi:predicted RecA/RadA family phage recombinase